MAIDFCRQSVVELAESVRAGERSARELVEHALARIEALNGRLNAFVAIDGDGALELADEVDARIKAGDDPGPLAGVPLGVKDTEDAAGFVTSKGSALFARSAPAERDSALVRRLRDSGCIVIGKTNTPELAWKADTDNPTFGATKNPWDLERSPGGSSGGSAAAVASGMVAIATASDEGGSIRIPAAVCGLPGFKPSMGRVPSGGPEPPDWVQLSTRGVMTRTVADLAAVLDAVIGPDPTDLRSLPMPEPSWLGAIDSAHLPMKVAWSPTLGYANVDSEVLKLCEAAVARFESLGAKVVEIDAVFPADPAGTWLTITSAYNARTLGPARGTPDWDLIDPGLRPFVEMGLDMKAVEFVEAEVESHRLNIRLVELFHDVRLLVTPTTAAAAPRSGQPGEINGNADINWVRFTYPFNLTRSPAGTVCAGLTSSGLPVGLQLVGPQHGDLVVLRAMAALERELGVAPIPPLAQ